MADVRLTATNPEDSSVVPVACNEKGELKLEEPLVVEGPPGEKGDKGDPGDPFSGNFADDVTFGGDASFAGNAQVGGDANLGNAIGCRVNALGIFQATRNGDQPVFVAYDGSTKAIGVEISATGDASFAGGIISGSKTVTTAYSEIYSAGLVVVRRENQYKDQPVWLGGFSDGAFQSTSFIYGSGAARFAGNKAGFTEEGYFWCTTRRGDTVMLDVTSNGLASWVPYTPPNRLTELQDKWAEKDGILPVPHESSQDEPETPQ